MIDRLVAMFLATPALAGPTLLQIEALCAKAATYPKDAGWALSDLPASDLGPASREAYFDGQIDGAAVTVWYGRYRQLLEISP